MTNKSNHECVNCEFFRAKSVYSYNCATCANDNEVSISQYDPVYGHTYERLTCSYARSVNHLCFNGVFFKKRTTLLTKLVEFFKKNSPK